MQRKSSRDQRAAGPYHRIKFRLVFWSLMTLSPCESQVFFCLDFSSPFCFESFPAYQFCGFPIPSNQTSFRGKPYKPRSNWEELWVHKTEKAMRKTDFRRSWIQGSRHIGKLGLFFSTSAACFPPPLDSFFYKTDADYLLRCICHHLSVPRKENFLLCWARQMLLLCFIGLIYIRCPPRGRPIKCSGRTRSGYSVILGWSGKHLSVVHSGSLQRERMVS